MVFFVGDDLIIHEKKYYGHILIFRFRPTEEYTDTGTTLILGEEMQHITTLMIESKIVNEANEAQEIINNCVVSEIHHTISFNKTQKRRKICVTVHVKGTALNALNVSPISHMAPVTGYCVSKTGKVLSKCG